MTEPVPGKPVVRVDARAKVTGEARYAADENPAGLVHGMLVTSTVGRGSIASMDTARAAAAPGVLKIYTPFAPLKLAAGGGPIGPGQNWLPLQDTQVRHHGQVIGLVVAGTFEQARDAAALIAVRYDERPATSSFTEALGTAADPPAGLSFEPPTVDLLAEGVASIDDALKAGDVRVSATYSQPVEFHGAMEPHATTAAWADGRLTVHTSTQSPQGSAQTIAAALGLDPSVVRVINPYVGGGFGNKANTWSHPLLTAAAAVDLGRPVKTVVTRAQTFTVTGHRSAVSQRVALAARRDGTLVAVKHDAVASLSTSGSWFETGPGTTSRFLYRSPNIHVGQKVVTLDVPPSTFMRAPGEASGSFALESAMDELAAALGMDPVELRLRNDATRYPGRDVPWSSRHLDECYRVGAQRFGWSKRPRTPRGRTDGDWLVGMGTATAVYPANRLPASATVRLAADGTATVSTAGADLGTGMRTALGVLAAEGLQLDPGRVTAVLGDSALPSNFGAFGSASTAGAAPAVRAAADSAVRALVQLAVSDARSPLHGRDPATVTYRRGELTGGGRTVGFGALLTATGSDGVEGTGTTPAGDAAAPYAFHSFGAHFCEMRVNRWTGEPRLARLTTVIDAGRIVNPTTARSQIIGGAIFGVGQALLEAGVFEPGSGRLAGADLAGYLVPVNADVSPVDVVFLDHPDTVFTPSGVRGIGELGTVGAAAAVANAVHNATGIRVRDLPIRPEALLG